MFTLKRKRVATGPEMWIRSEGAFDAIGESTQFQKVQAIIDTRNRRFANEEKLDRLTRLFQSHAARRKAAWREVWNLPIEGAR